MSGAPDSRRSLLHVRAAQLRARLLRRGISQLMFATLFLIGALVFAVGPEPKARASQFWMSALSVLSTLHVGVGLRIFTRVKRWPRLAWPFATLAWGGMLTAVLRYLVLA